MQFVVVVFLMEAVAETSWEAVIKSFLDSAPPLRNRADVNGKLEEFLGLHSGKRADVYRAMCSVDFAICECVVYLNI